MAATGSFFVMISYYSFWSTLEMAVAPHIQLSQHPTTSPSATLPKVQLPLLGTIVPRCIQVFCDVRLRSVLLKLDDVPKLQSAGQSKSIELLCTRSQSVCKNQNFTALEDLRYSSINKLLSCPPTLRLKPESVCNDVRRCYLSLQWTK